MGWGSVVLSFLTFEHFSSVLNFLWKWASEFFVLDFLLNLAKNDTFPLKINRNMTRNKPFTLRTSNPILDNWASKCSFSSKSEAWCSYIKKNVVIVVIYLIQIHRTGRKQMGWHRLASQWLRLQRTRVTKSVRSARKCASPCSCVRYAFLAILTFYFNLGKKRRIS